MKHLLAGGTLFLFPLVAFAESQAVSDFKGSLTAAAGVSGLQNIQSPGELVGDLINVVLSLAGLVLVCILVYAGILYMQGGSDEKNVTRAKGMILNSIIGLVLILASYAIASFILASITGAVSAPTSP